MFLRVLVFIWLINSGQLLIAQCPPLLQEEVTALSPAAGDRLGYDVAVASGLAAVSASLYDLPSPDAGAVHLLGYDSLTGRWELQNGGDVVFILDYLFSSGAEPPAPFNTCGIDPTADPLGCESFSVCP